MNDNGNSTFYDGNSTYDGNATWYSDRRQCLPHDLRHALFTLRTGIALLGQVREDPEKFAEVQQLLENEVGTASELVNELLGRPDLTTH